MIAAICFIATLFHIYRFDDDGEEDEPVFATSTADAHDNKGYIPEVDDETTFSPGQKIGHVANGHINVSDDDSFQIKESGTYIWAFQKVVTLRTYIYYILQQWNTY